MRESAVRRTHHLARCVITTGSPIIAGAQIDSVCGNFRIHAVKLSYKSVIDVDDATYPILSISYFFFFRLSFISVLQSFFIILSTSVRLSLCLFSVSLCLSLSLSLSLPFRNLYTFSFPLFWSIYRKRYFLRQHISFFT